MQWIVVHVFCSDNLIRSDPLLYPKLQGFQQIVFGIDNWPITGAVSERIWTGAPITMCHSRRHEDAVKIMNVSHNLCDFFIIIEAILRRDRGVRPSGILDHLAAMMLERSRSGLLELTIGAIVLLAFSNSLSILMLR